MPAALVTGAARRIGRAIALRLAEAGYDVAVHHHGSAEEAKVLAADIEGGGRRATALKADLMDEAAVRALPSLAAERLGPVTLLVNNASLFLDDRLGRLARSSWEAHMAVNLRAPLVLTEAFAALLAPDLPNAEASVVNILDQRVLKLNPQFFSYALSKSALWNATRMAAQALAPRIRVNGVGPGPTLASIHQDAAIFAQEAAATPLGQGSTAAEIAEAVLYLARARAVTGQMIAVDGGQHLAWKTSDIVSD